MENALRKRYVKEYYKKTHVFFPNFLWTLMNNIIIIIVGLNTVIQSRIDKIDTNPLMRLSPRRESPGTHMAPARV